MRRRRRRHTRRIWLHLGAGDRSGSSAPPARGRVQYPISHVAVRWRSQAGKAAAWKSERHFRNGCCFLAIIRAINTCQLWITGVEAPDPEPK